MNVADGEYEGTGTPIKLSRTPAIAAKAPPRFSEHARDVLREHGLADDAIEALAASGVLVESRRR